MPICDQCHEGTWVDADTRQLNCSWRGDLYLGYGTPVWNMCPCIGQPSPLQTVRHSGRLKIQGQIHNHLLLLVCPVRSDWLVFDLLLMVQQLLDNPSLFPSPVCARPSCNCWANKRMVQLTRAKEPNKNNGSSTKYPTASTTVTTPQSASRWWSEGEPPLPPQKVRKQQTQNFCSL